MSEANKMIVWGVGTTRTLRVHWMLHELGLSYETRRIESRTGETQADEYVALNPKQKIPTLQDGELVLSESTAIMRHLRRISDTLPYDDYQLSLAGQAAYDEWLSFMLMELDATSLYVIRRHKDLFKIYGKADNAVSSSVTYFERMLDAVMDRIEGQTYLWGSTFSEIDMHMSILLEWGRAVGAEIPAAATAYQQPIKARPAYRAAAKLNFSNLQIQTVRPDPSD